MKDDDHGTQGTPGPSTDNDSVTVDDPAILKKVGKSVQNPGYNTNKEDSPAGLTAEDTTGIDPQDPIDPASPGLIPN